MKIRDLNTDIIDQMVELECTNILPILASVGINLTPQHMREQLEYFKDSDVVVRYDNGVVDGFVMYEISGSEINIISFNLRKFNNIEILTALLTEIFNNLQGKSIEIIKSRAHHTNTKSLNFHRRMGFKEVGTTKHDVEFEIGKNHLLSIIQKRVRS
jgi:hypothetical protein